MPATLYKAGEPVGEFFNYTDAVVEADGVTVEPELPYAISETEEICFGWFAVVDFEDLPAFDKYRDRFSDDVVIFEKHVAYYAAGKGHARAFHMDGARLIHVCRP